MKCVCRGYEYKDVSCDCGFLRPFKINLEENLAQWDQGGGCPCGVSKECNCENKIAQHGRDIYNGAINKKTNTMKVRQVETKVTEYELDFNRDEFNWAIVVQKQIVAIFKNQEDAEDYLKSPNHYSLRPRSIVEIINN